MLTPHYREIEIKISFKGTRDQAQALIESRGYTIQDPRVLESDQLFDRSGELRAADQLLRLRHIGDLATVTYKGPGNRERHKSREEIEFDVSDPAAYVLVLSRLGYQPTFRYEKYRTKFAVPGEPGIITIDETPIGIYLEIEGEPEWIDATAAKLGYSPRDYSTESYASLYRKYQAAHPGSPADMLFV
jgi:adenylate cyclase class 2